MSIDWAKAEERPEKRLSVEGRFLLDLRSKINTLEKQLAHKTKDFDKTSNKVKETLEQADLIICKGMANYESFSETDYHPIAYLLRTKCSAIANSMNIPININAIKVI